MNIIIHFHFTFSRLKVSSGAVMIMDCSSEFFPCNEVDTILLTILAFSIQDITSFESGITILSRFMIDDLKKKVFPIIKCFTRN